MATSPASSAKSSVTTVVVTGTIYIGISATLIAFNKHLMAPGVFPFPAAIGLLHACFCSTFAAVLYMIKPGLFTSLTDPVKKVNVMDGMLWKAILPIAVFFAAQIVLTNQAFLYADIAFLQMMKESNVVAVYFLAVAFALEVFKWRQMNLIFMVCFATWMTVTGDLTFTWIGFILACASCLAESSKITLQGVLLSSAGKGLDAFSYMLLVMPMSAVIFGGVLMIFRNNEIMPMPTLADWVTMRWVLLLNSFIALGLNISILVFIKCSSAVAFVLAGIIKDVIIVLAGILFFGHPTTMLQVCGFTLQVFLILIYSLLKTFPKEFASGTIIEGVQQVFFGLSLEQTKMPESNTADYGAANDRDARLSCPEDCPEKDVKV